MKRLLTARDQAERALFWLQAGTSPEEELAQGVGVERWRKLTYPDLDLDHNAFNRLPEEERRRFAQEYDEYVRNLDQKGKMRLSRRTAAEDAADPQLQSYLDQAQKNLMATSRTAQGVIDTSASPDKADQMHDISGDQAASLAANNYRDVIARAYADRNRQFGSPQEVRDFVEGMAAQVNGGILKGPLLRQHDSDKYPYTPVAQLPQAADEFYTQLHQRLNDPAADPIDTAAWAEYHVNPGHHFFGDGAGKTSKALSSYILMRNGLPLPTYPGGNEEYFKNVTRTIPIGQDPQADEESLNNFLRYYRSMMPGQQQKTSAAPAPQVAPLPPELTVADSAPGADRPLMLVYGGGFNPPHQGHVGALRSAYDALAKAGYKVDGSIVAPTADKLLAKKQMDEALRLRLQDRAAVARAAFPPDINGSPISIRTEPADEIERGTTKPRRSDLARWAQSQYPDHTIVNVSGEDAAVPGAPGVFPSLYSGEIGSNHEGVNYITLPRDLDGGISSSKIRAALSGGGPLEGMTPESEQAYRDALARHQATQAPMTVTGGRTLWASFCREWGV